MKYLALLVLCAGILNTLAPQPVVAAPGMINRACLRANRPAASTKLCNCIQRVANRNLSRSDRRTVSKWFADPHKAQQVRQSDRSKDEALWKRYKAFGEKARQTCG